MSGAPESSTLVLISALRVLSRDIQSQDGVANAAMLEAAQRMEKLDTQVQGLKRHAEALATALDGYQECCGEEHPRPKFDCPTCGKEEKVLAEYRAFRKEAGL